MSDILFLNCLVLGDTLDCIFPVKIASSETVGILREVIKVKKHHAFHGIDADQLNLYRTSEEVANLDDDELIQALTIPLKQAKHKKLGPQFPLSNSFSNALPLSVLHVLVELPSTFKGRPSASILIMISLSSSASSVPQAAPCLNSFVLGNHQGPDFDEKLVFESIQSMVEL